MDNLLKLTLLTSTLVQDRSFNNSIQTDGLSRLFPSALKVNDTYYVVARVIKDSKIFFEISTSQDLNEWQPATNVFEGDNAPAWVEHQLNTPRMHQIGSKFVLYFSGKKTQQSKNAVGAAVAEHPLGPYKPIQMPILEDAISPSIITDRDNIYLVWSQDKDNSEIALRQLNYDGLSFLSEEFISLLNASLGWEKKRIYSPWHIKRRNYHYLFYTGYGQCDESATGVARSRSVFGPYTKLPVPVIESNGNFFCTHSASIVKDLDGQGDIVVFNGNRMKSQLKSSILASLNWDDDEWPYVGNF